MAQTEAKVLVFMENQGEGSPHKFDDAGNCWCAWSRETKAAVYLEGAKTVEEAIAAAAKKYGIDASLVQAGNPHARA